MNFIDHAKSLLQNICLSLSLCFYDDKYDYKIFKVYYVGIDRKDIEAINNYINKMLELLGQEYMTEYFDEISANIDSVSFVPIHNIPAPVVPYAKSICLHYRCFGSYAHLASILVFYSHYIKCVRQSGRAEMIYYVESYNVLGKFLSLLPDDLNIKEIDSYFAKLSGVQR